MSGGVDSSVAAALLVRQGYDCVGVTMKLFEDGADLPDRPCCSLDATSDARRVAERLGIPHYVLNMVDHFGRDVIADFVAEYAAGRTPIPCVRCNTFTKFSDLVAKADAIDAGFVATGHYARVAGGALHRGADDAKDQSYFLWGIDRAVLPRLKLPVGEMTKAETRAIARELDLPRVADKPESQEICFVPDGDYVQILRRERAGVGEVVIKAVFDHGPDGDLGFREQLFDRVGQQVGGGVANHLQALGVFGGHDGQLGIARDGVAGVHQFTVDLTGQCRFGQACTDAGGDLGHGDWAGK